MTALKRPALFLLIVVLLFVSTPTFQVYADDKPHTGYDDCTAIPEFYNANNTAAIEYWQQIQSRLPSGTAPIIMKSGSTYPLNFRLWHDKGLVVYGSYKLCNPKDSDWKPATQPGGPTALVLEGQGYYSKNGKRGEYRYHGFTATGDRFTNIDFPVDAYNGPEQNKDWIQFPWTSSKISPPLNRTMYSYSANNENNPVTQRWINNAVNFSIQGQSNVAYQYMHILQPPSTNYPGQGRMWHLRSNGVWYQSFPIPKMDASTKIAAKTSDIEVTLTVNNPASDFEFIDHKEKSDNETITVNVTVTARLLDEAYYNDPVERVNHYTRDDIDKWILTLNGEAKTVARWTENSAKAVFEIQLKKSQIKGLPNRRLLLSAKGQALFLDSSRSPEKPTTGYAQFIIDNEPVPPSPPEPSTPPDPEISPIVFEPDPVVPEYAFDIVKFPASDNSDMSTMETREVFIDGIKVNDMEFFAGNYVFGEDNTGLKQVTINYTSVDGQKAQVVKWILVYNTRPRAQFKLEGTYKQMRKLSLTNTSLPANDEILLQHFPITSYQWEYRTIDGEDGSLKIRSGSSDLFKEFLYKKPGTYQIVLQAVNSLGRVSEPYVLQYVIAPDVPPAIEICLDNSVLGRNETISAYHYMVSSTDGDVIKSNSIELWYDSNNDDTYDQLLNTYNGSSGFPSYTPTKLGRYKYVNRVDEDYGQDTLQEYVTPSDKAYKVQEVEFLVDNYIPMTDIYIDIPVVRPQIDVFIMNDANFDITKNNYILSNRMNFDNFLRSRNILPQVRTWDMHTYTYSQPAYTTVHSGSSYPPSSTYYSSGGYSGTLYRTSVSDNGYNYDFGHYETRTDSKTATGSFTGYSKNTYRWNGSSWAWVSSTGTDTPSIQYNQDGYTGTLYKTGFYKSGESGDPPSNPKVGDTYTHTDYYTASYSGTVTKQVTVWVPDWRWVSDYTGHYSGTIYNSVRQPYVDPFRATSGKYIIYVSDNNISELNDLQAVMSKTDAKLLLIGAESMKSQISYDHFIVNNKPIDQIMSEAITYVAESSPAVQKYYVLAGQYTFTMNTANFDEENDPIVEEKFQYVQDQSYFDNPTGLENYASEDFSENSGWTDLKVNKFSKTGEFHIYRRIKDRPTTDSNFAGYSYYSGTPEIIIYSHRKPVAMAELSWDYNLADNMYKTTWVDRSYDPDHQYNRSDKGIVGRKIMYRRSGGEWNYKIPDRLQYGSYELLYYVRDPEGAWSDPFTLNFTLDYAPSMQFDGKLCAFDSSFSLSSIPASEYLEAFDLWTRYPYTVYLQSALYNGYTALSPVKTIYYGSSTGSKSGNDIRWYNYTQQIPDTVPDGYYTFRIMAYGDGGKSAVKEFPVRVLTPINLNAAINGLSSNATVTAASDNTFTFATSKYVSRVALQFKGRTYTSNSGDISLKSSSGSGKTWEMVINPPISWFTSDETGYAAFTAYTPSGKSETANVNYKVITVKAWDFTITSILDIGWRGYYFDLEHPINGDGERYGYPKRANTDIKTTAMPINSLGLISYGRESVKAGAGIKGTIRISGVPDSARLTAKYTSSGIQHTANIPLVLDNGDRYKFEWTIPIETDSRTYVYFDIVMSKGGNTYGNDKWTDTWPSGNTMHNVIYVDKKVTDDLRVNQSH